MSDRRSFLRGLTTLPLIGSSVALATPQAAWAGESSGDIEELWKQYLGAQGVAHALFEARGAAEERLPWWAKMGPAYIDHEGNHTGGLVGWPAIQGLAPPEREGSLALLRPSEYSIRRDYELMRKMIGEAKPRSRFDERMRDLQDRLAAQAHEKQLLGLDDLEAKADAASDRVLAIIAAIEDAPPVSLSVTAAQILVHTVSDASVTDTPEDLTIMAVALRGLLPHLSGAIAESAAEIVRFPERPISEMQVWRGVTTLV